MTMFQHRPDKDDIYRDNQPALRARDGTVYVFDGKIAVEILKSDNFRNFDLHKSVLELERLTGISFSASHRIFGNLAPVRDGSEHRGVRLDLARRMNELHEPLLRDCEAIIEAVVKTSFVPFGQVDLCEDLFFRIYSSNARLISGLEDIDVQWAARVLTVTFAQTSLRTRIEIDKDLGRRSAQIEGSDDEVALKMALIILGSEAFTGGLVRSVWEVIERQPGLALCDIDWPPSLPTTAAPVVERLALADWDNGQIQARKGDKIRVVIGASTPYGPLPTEDVIFGRGRHSCVGRRLTEELWAMFVSKISTLDLIPELVSIETRRPDNFLNFPNHALVSFHDSRN